MLELLRFTALRLLLPLHEAGKLSPRLLVSLCCRVPQGLGKSVVESGGQNVCEYGNVQYLIAIVTTHSAPLRFVGAAQEVAVESFGKCEGSMTFLAE
jgi:hypothetical protein